jgi:hypothetical protein
MEFINKENMIGFKVSNEDLTPVVCTNAGGLSYARKIKASDWECAIREGRVQIGRASSKTTSEYLQAYLDGVAGPIILTNCHAIYVTFTPENIAIDGCPEEGTAYAYFTNYSGKD